MLAARFPYLFIFKYCIQLFRRRRRLIRKGENTTEIIYRLVYLCIFLHRYGRAALVLRH
jgi:hypothetical protein